MSIINSDIIPEGAKVGSAQPLSVGEAIVIADALDHAIDSFTHGGWEPWTVDGAPDEFTYKAIMAMAAGKIHMMLGETAMRVAEDRARGNA